MSPSGAQEAGVVTPRIWVRRWRSSFDRLRTNGGMAEDAGGLGDVTPWRGGVTGLLQGDHRMMVIRGALAAKVGVSLEDGPPIQKFGRCARSSSRYGTPCGLPRRTTEDERRGGLRGRSEGTHA